MYENEFKDSSAPSKKIASELTTNHLVVEIRILLHYASYTQTQTKTRI